MTHNPSSIGPPRLVADELDDLLSDVPPEKLAALDAMIDAGLAELVERWSPWAAPNAARLPSVRLEGSRRETRG